jgi:probable rRNA maturation factor
MPHHDITLIIHEPRWRWRLRPYGQTVRTACAAALAGLPRKAGSVELSVVLSDDAFVRQLNHKYRGKDKPTNVLSFPSGDASSLGDVILAFETVAQEAVAQQKTFRDHATHLIVHGVLHLLGHDHEDEREAQAMEQYEIKILKKLGVKNPYLS